MPDVGLTRALSQGKKALDTYNDNIANSQVIGARTIDPVITQTYNGRSVTTLMQQVRRSNPLLENIQINQLTNSTEFETISTALNVVQNEISDKLNPQQSTLVNSVADFLSQSTILAANSTSSARHTFVERGKILATNFNEITNRIVDLRFSSDKDLGASITNANEIIRSIFTINKTIKQSGIASGSKALNLFDKRDEFVTNLAKLFEINYTYTTQGEVLIRDKRSSLPIVDNTSYSQLNYQGFSSRAEILSEKEPKTIDLTIINNKSGDRIVYKSTVGNGPNILGGGKIGGLISLRDDILKETYGVVQQLVKSVTDTVNKVHNGGSTWPPATKFQSNITVQGNEILDWGGKVSIYPVDDKGNQLSGGGGPLNAINIDFDKLSNANGSIGSPTVWDVIRELNSQLEVNPSRNRLAMGLIQVNDPIIGGVLAAAPNEYLLNNVQLAGMSKITDQGGFIFDLDLTGNQYFGSNVEVLEVTTSNGYSVPIEELPTAFRLEKDTNSRTADPIVVNGINPAQAQTISVKIRVTGDNGAMTEGTAVFAIDPASTPNLPDLTNRRVSANAAGLAVQGNGFGDAPISHTGIATVKLVDDKGLEIPEGLSTAGKIVIETNNSSYALAIQGGNFSNLLKFNDLIQHNEGTGLIKIRDDIVVNMNLLSTGRVSRTNGKVINASIGQTQATGNLTFSGNNFAPASRITIKDQTFTFIAGIPANQNQIQVTGALNTDVIALRNAIENHNALKGIINAIPSGNLGIDLSSKIAGTAGNILVSSNTVGTNLTIITNGITSGPGTNIASNLSGGTDNTNATIILYNYTIGDKSSEVIEDFNDLKSKIIDFTGSDLVPSISTTLVAYASQITTILSDQAGDAVSDYTISTEVLNKIQERVKNELGINPQEQYIKLLEQSQSLRDLALVNRKSRDIIEEIHRILFN
jgi:flagellar hook-associated protein 1 FlgK